MQFTLAAAALIATASAATFQRREEYNFNSSCDAARPLAKVINRCSYPVHLWSIEKQLGCPDGAGLKLEQGEFYYENLRNTTDGGISIKLSKYESCGSNDLTQLEYKLNWASGYEGDYLDISFVNCLTGDCPGWHDGFYFKSGNQEEKIQTSAVDNQHCPIFSVANAIEAAAVAYVKWDDVQTKWCPNDASMELYLCGSEAPGEGGDDSTPAPSSSQQAAPSYQAPSSQAPSSQYVQKPSSTPKPVETPSPSEYAVAAAAVTSAPAAQPPHVVKTEVVYETVYVKRHAHGRRHQHFHA